MVTFKKVRNVEKVYTGAWLTAWPRISWAAKSAALRPVSFSSTPTAARAPACTMLSDPAYQGVPAPLAASLTAAAAGATVLSAGVYKASTAAHSSPAACCTSSEEETVDSVTVMPRSAQAACSASTWARALASSGL